uniref:Uncharacterized protein n=1 Tax=Colobus angolensis palliatus TaxID=336983 RepID=A0A2K5J354_COLAP
MHRLSDHIFFVVVHDSCCLGLKVKRCWTLFLSNVFHHLDKDLECSVGKPENVYYCGDVSCWMIFNIDTMYFIKTWLHHVYTMVFFISTLDSF